MAPSSGGRRGRRPVVRRRLQQYRKNAPVPFFHTARGDDRHPDHRNDVSSIQKVTPSRVTCWALVLLTMALVGWIRLPPQSLGIADDRGDRIARRLRSELTLRWR
jgi:hypothetical protein